MHIQKAAGLLQVRFGVLNAGNFGVSQSRKRTFIWAAAPGELLPDWPDLLHIFRSPQLAIKLPGDIKVFLCFSVLDAGQQYAAEGYKLPCDPRLAIEMAGITLSCACSTQLCPRQKGHLCGQ